MINTKTSEAYEILKNKYPMAISTVRDSSINQETPFIDSTIEVVNFDTIKEEFTKYLNTQNKGRVNEPASVDCIILDSKLYLVEFKDMEELGGNKNFWMNCRLKVLDTLAMLKKILGFHLDFSSQVEILFVKRKSTGDHYKKLSANESDIKVVPKHLNYLELTLDIPVTVINVEEFRARFIE